MNNFLKKLLFMLLLLFSPLATMAVLGAAYIAVRVLSGLEFLAATFILAHLIKYKIKVTNLRK